MADRTVSQLTATTAAGDDKIYVSKTSGGPLDRSLTLDELVTFVGTGTGYTGSQGATGYTGSIGSSTIKTASIVLTDAEIKALPTTGSYVIVAAPGANKMHYIHSAILRVDCTAGVYTNIAADNSQLGVDLDDALSTVGVMYNMSAPNSPDGNAHAHIDAFLGDASFPNAFMQQAPALPAPGGLGPNADINYIDLAITLTCTNEFDGDYTGGNAANTMTVIVWYSTMDLTTGTFV